jgi:hypothetical protein
MSEQFAKRWGAATERFGGAVGAGLVLVLLPSLTLVFKMDDFRRNPTFGYPILAIFGIMMLLGALALVSTLFSRLQLSAPHEALALPPGSIRATIALSLIVLFALLSVMLYQSLSGSDPVIIKGLSEAAKLQLATDPSNELRVTPVACPAAMTGAAPDASGAGAAAPAASANAAGAPPDPCSNGALFKYDIQIGHATTGPAVDFAKQLLTLIGTLMTSVVSFYFAAKSSEAVATKTIEGMKKMEADEAHAHQAGADAQDHEHGGVIAPTPDADLPPAEGGVAPPDPKTPA